ncbi:hypothetical protein CLOP_g10471 [Closterium sp. NIES-67]|nr:hypothetical protein CLOP_g10471 [Closterium sp. NIES-67]
MLQSGTAAATAAAAPLDSTCSRSLITISRLHVVNGWSRSKGGCMLLQGVNAVLSDLTLSNCFASESGGGMQISNAPGPITMRHVTIRNCSVSFQVPSTNQTTAGSRRPLAAFPSSSSFFSASSFSSAATAAVVAAVAAARAIPAATPAAVAAARATPAAPAAVAASVPSSSSSAAATAAATGSDAAAATGADAAAYVAPIQRTGVTIRSSSFQRCMSTTGGAVYDYMSTFDVSHTAFLSSSAVLLPSDYTTGVGGCLKLNSTAAASFAHCRFAHCSAFITGGAVTFYQGDAQPQIHNCTFEENEALIQGGSIELVFVKGPANFTDCTFRRNRVTNGPSFGAAILSLGVPMRVERSRFERNIAVNMMPPVADGDTFLTQGGAIAANMFMDPLVVYDIIDSDFVENQAGQGGALYADTGRITLLNCLFLRNGDHANSSLGGAITSRGRTVIDNCSFVDNKAQDEGGALHFLPYDNLTIANSLFQRNSVLKQNGGAINVYAGTGAVRVVNTTFVNNTAESSKGGAVYSESVSITFDNVTLDGNKAGLQGGAVAVYASSSDGVPTEASFLSCRFVRNEAVLGGGAIYSGLSMRMRMQACVVEANNSTGLGGAVLVQEFSRVDMTRTLCQGNIALTGGACLSLLANAQATVTDSVLQGNEGGSEGGAARISGSAHLSLLSSSVSRNTAAWGGAVWVEMGASLIIDNRTMLAGNRAQYLGGTVYATHVSRVEVRGGSVFRDNSALHGGALVVGAEARVSASDCAFENNTLSAILFQGFSQGSLRNCSFSRNSNAAGRGGAMLVGDRTTVAVHSCHFAKNWAALGGAVSTEGGPYLTINGSHFTRNIAQIGAGVALAGTTSFAMGDSVFSGNNATKAGGGVAVLEQVTGEITGSRFAGNYAVVGGAGVYLLRSAAADSPQGSASAREKRAKRARNSRRIALASSSSSSSRMRETAATGGASTPNGTTSSSSASLQSTNQVLCRGLVFDGNSAMDAHGVAFFEASYSPDLRSACGDCLMLQPPDTQGSMPADFYLTWPGAAASSKETGGSFSVVGAMGSMLTGLQVVVVDQFGNVVSKDDSALARVSPDSRISGSLRGTAQAGIITVPPIAVRVSPADALQPIPLTVTVSSITNAFPDFSHPFNISFCPAGQYFDGESFSCQDCPVGHWCAPGQGMETCPDGTFTFYPNAVSEDECTPCDDDSLDCRYGTMQIDYQNWLDPASLNSTPTTYACLLTNGCSGTTYTGPNTTQCAVGYNNTVAMCSLCADGYYLVLQFCEQCTSAFKSVFPLLLVIVLVVWVAMNMLADTFAAMDIFLTEVQLLAMVASFNLNFPASWVKTVVLLYNIAAFDPDIIGPECVFSLQFTGKFYMNILIPVIGLLVYALVFAHHRWLGGSFFIRVHSWQRKERQKQRLLQHSVTKRRAYNEYENSIVHASLKWLDICYVSVMVKVLQVFKSQTVGSATVMAAAPQILWLSPVHVGMLVTAVLVTLVYLVGLPALFAGVLIDAHTCDVLSSALFKQRFGWLTERFTPKFWWWHLTNIGLRVLHGCILVFLQQETKSQPRTTRPRPSPRSLWSNLQALLTLGQFFFTLSLVCYNYLNLSLFSQILFGFSSAFILIPTITLLVYDCVNNHLDLANARMLHRVWKAERKRQKARFDKMDPYDLVPAQDICAWFRPHIIFATLLTNRTEERRLLLRVRDRFETCRLVGLAPMDWLNHLKKPQLYAVLAQALLGASTGHVTVARVPKDGWFCRAHGVWHASGEECQGRESLGNGSVHGMGQQQRGDSSPGESQVNGLVDQQQQQPLLQQRGGGRNSWYELDEADVWPPQLESHVIWASSSVAAADVDNMGAAAGGGGGGRGSGGAGWEGIGGLGMRVGVCGE